MALKAPVSNPGRALLNVLQDPQRRFCFGIKFQHKVGEFSRSLQTRQAITSSFQSLFCLGVFGAWITCSSLEMYDGLKISP